MGVFTGPESERTWSHRHKLPRHLHIAMQFLEKETFLENALDKFFAIEIHLELPI